MHLLNAGRVKLYQSTGSGRQALLRIVSPGSVFGLRTVLSISNHSASAEAQEESRAVVWNRSTMTRLIESNRQISLNVLWIAVRHLEELQETYVHLTTQPVERRVAWALALLERKIGQRTNNGLVVLESVSARDLSDLAGTTIYTISRILSDWERQGALTKHRKQIVLRQPRMLAELAKSLH